MLPVCLQCKHHQYKYHKCKHRNIIHAVTVTLTSDATAHMSIDSFVVRKHLECGFKFPGARNILDCGFNFPEAPIHGTTTELDHSASDLHTGSTQ